MSWTDLTDPDLAPGKILTTGKLLALRDNPIAIANGGPGAPKIQNDAMDTDSVDNDNVVNGTLGAEKFQTGTTERDWVLGRIAGLAAGAVGTYAMVYSSQINISFGSTVAGSDLEPSNAPNTSTGLSLTGTWRCCGNVGAGTGDGDRVTLFVRIS